MRHRKFKMGKKGVKKADIELETLAWWIIALAVLVLGIIVYLILSGKGASALEYIKNLFRFQKVG